jgi:hypothetical protein
MQEMSGANELYEEEHQEEHDAPVGERGYPSCEEITWPERSIEEIQEDADEAYWDEHSDLLKAAEEEALAYEEALAEDDSDRGWNDFIGDDVDASAAVDRDASRGPVVGRRMGYLLYADDFDDDMPF